MIFSHPSLHPPIITSATDMQAAEARMFELLATQPAVAGEADATSDFIEIPLTTVSLDLNFDSFISVGLRSSATPQALFPLLLDTGNTVLVLPWWEDIEALPDWQSVKTDITLKLGDASGAFFTYEIDTRALPAPVRGLTLVMCENNCFMEGQNGMNIGGVSALSIRILIDYQNARVGLKNKSA